MSSFKQSLSRGEVGEILFYEAHDGKLERLDGFKSDFIQLETGQGLELKTDYWSMSSTPNFFFEQYSDRDKKSPGGPWQAAKNKSDIFVYFFIKDLTFFQFDTHELVSYLEQNIDSFKPRDILNKTYITSGVLVPRDLVKPLYTQKRLSVGIKE